MKARKVELEQHEAENAGDYKALADIIQSHMLKEKDFVDKSQDAFVSFIRYYKEHQLSFIFAFSMLEIGQVANSFFLFRLPRVKEILGRKIDGFETRKDVDLS